MSATATLTAESVDTLALVPTEPKATLLPVFRGAEMTRAVAAYKDVQQALDRAMPDQIMTLDGKPFRKKAYWKAIAVAFNLTVEAIEERREVCGTLADGSDNYVYFVTYRATTPGGRAATGDGACSASEKARGRMKATEHNVRSHAHTRASNRAVSNLVGFGEVSAEEIDREGPAPVTAAALPTPEPPGFDRWLMELELIATQGTSALQTAWAKAPRDMRAYLTTQRAATWQALKTRAAEVRS